MKEYKFNSELEACSPVSMTESPLLNVAYALVTPVCRACVQSGDSGKYCLRSYCLVTA